MTRTRRAVGYHRKTGKLFDLGDTVEGALKANMMLKDYEKELIRINPQLDITFKLEKR